MCCHWSYGAHRPTFPLWDHLALRRCWLEGTLPGGEGTLPVGGWGCPTNFDGPFGVYTCLTFHDRSWVPVMEEWHSLCCTSYGWAWLWWVQRYSPHVLSHSCSMCSSLSHLLWFFLCIASHDDIQMEFLCQVGPAAGTPIALLVYLGRSIPMVLMVLLVSLRWTVTQMSWATCQVHALHHCGTLVTLRSRS